MKKCFLFILSMFSLSVYANEYNPLDRNLLMNKLYDYSVFVNPYTGKYMNLLGNGLSLGFDYTKNRAVYLYLSNNVKYTSDKKAYYPDGWAKYRIYLPAGGSGNRITIQDNPNTNLRVHVTVVPSDGSNIPVVDHAEPLKKMSMTKTFEVMVNNATSIGFDSSYINAHGGVWVLLDLTKDTYNPYYLPSENKLNRARIYLSSSASYGGLDLVNKWVSGTTFIAGTGEPEFPVASLTVRDLTERTLAVHTRKFSTERGTMHYDSLQAYYQGVGSAVVASSSSSVSNSSVSSAASSFSSSSSSSSYSGDGIGDPKNYTDKTDCENAGFAWSGVAGCYEPYNGNVVSSSSSVKSSSSSSSSVKYLTASSSSAPAAGTPDSFYNKTDCENAGFVWSGVAGCYEPYSSSSSVPAEESDEPSSSSNASEAVVTQELKIEKIGFSDLTSEQSTVVESAVSKMRGRYVADGLFYTDGTQWYLKLRNNSVIYLLDVHDDTIHMQKVTDEDLKGFQRYGLLFHTQKDKNGYFLYDLNDQKTYQLSPQDGALQLLPLLRADGTSPEAKVYGDIITYK